VILPIQTLHSPDSTDSLFWDPTCFNVNFLRLFNYWRIYPYVKVRWNAKHRHYCACNTSDLPSRYERNCKSSKKHADRINENTSFFTNCLLDLKAFCSHLCWIFICLNRIEITDFLFNQWFKILHSELDGLAFTHTNPAIHHTAWQDKCYYFEKDF